MIGRPEPAVVIDTNVIVSALLFRYSQPRLALDRAFGQGRVLSSSSTRNELREVFSRPKFDRYVPRTRRLRDLEELIEAMDSINVADPVYLCRDPKDDKFLTLALAGSANFIITGDADLLALHPFRTTIILTPIAYLAH